MNSRHTLLTVTVLALVGGAPLVGCEKKAPKAPETAAAPAAPKAVDPMEGIADILDAKVQWPDKYPATTPEQAQAVAALANAIAKGDAESAKSVIDEPDREVLQGLIDFGDWASQTRGVQAVRVCVFTEGDDKKTLTLGLGVQDATGAYMIAWKGTEHEGPAWVFSGMAIEPVTAASVAMLDGATLRAPVLTAAAVEKKLNEVEKPKGAGADAATGGGAPPPSNNPFRKPTGDE